MGSLIKSFTVARNALKRDEEQSAVAAMRSIERVRNGVNLTDLKATDNGAYNVIRDLSTFTGIISRSGENASVTPVGEAFERLYKLSAADAWRWLLTRSLWLYIVPNGTQAAVNTAASQLGYDFGFFRTFLGLLTTLAALPGDLRFVSFEELCLLYSDDAAWQEDSTKLMVKVLQNRVSNPKIESSARAFLDDLENSYSIPRDNFSALIGKAYSQTGLFEYRRAGGKVVAIALSSTLDAVLHRRVRHVIDNPVSWGGQDWEEFLALKGGNELPEEVSLAPSEEPPEVEELANLSGLVETAASDLATAGLRYENSLIKRFAAALLAKRFVILTGLSGSGKTRLAQAFAAWICPKWSSPLVRFSAGEVVESNRVQYRVTASDALAVEFESDGTLVALPYALIDEWIEVIKANGFTKKSSAREIREVVTKDSAYSSQLSSFETHLKAAAFALIERKSHTSVAKHFEIVSVGPDWTSRDSSLGYVDALNPGSFVRTTEIVDLLLRANADPTQPFFLILDEMNLSHVERYFSDFLSSAESDEPIFIHGGTAAIDGVPPRLPWPTNLFVVGTVNVDETTYMFSPKVLDRANTIEFRVSRGDMHSHMSGTEERVSIRKLEGAGAAYARAFLAAGSAGLNKAAIAKQFGEEIGLLFDVLQGAGAEFGFRSATEMLRFFQAYELLGPAEDPSVAVDAQVLQKVLPRMNGSRKRLEGLLCALGVFCCHPRAWSEGALTEQSREQIASRSKEASQLSEPSLHPLSPTYEYKGNAVLPTSFFKIKRMLERVDSDGFTSFAEA